MQYGICSLSLVPVRNTGDACSQMLTQLLYGEHFKILESRKEYCRIRIAFDGCEGWVSNDQVHLITAEQYQELNIPDSIYNGDLIAFVTERKKTLSPILLGASVAACPLLGHYFEGRATTLGPHPKSEFIQTALHYLDAPELQGGKSPFGIDSAGFTQMVYKINGERLLRSAPAQATQGEALSFIEESEAGDLAFFDDHEGIIDHVGLIMEDNYIVHVHGKVRVDRLDHTGIFNTEKGRYTHSLRVIKKLR